MSCQRRGAGGGCIDGGMERRAEETEERSKQGQAASEYNKTDFMKRRKRREGGEVGFISNSDRFS